MWLRVPEGVSTLSLLCRLTSDKTHFREKHDSLVTRTVSTDCRFMWGVGGLILEKASALFQKLFIDDGSQDEDVEFEDLHLPRGP